MHSAVNWGPGQCTCPFFSYPGSVSTGTSMAASNRITTSLGSQWSSFVYGLPRVDSLKYSLHVLALGMQTTHVAFTRYWWILPSWSPHLNKQPKISRLGNIMRVYETFGWLCLNHGRHLERVIGRMLSSTHSLLLFNGFFFFFFFRHLSPLWPGHLHKLIRDAYKMQVWVVRFVQKSWWYDTQHTRMGYQEDYAAQPLSNCLHEHVT